MAEQDGSQASVDARIDRDPPVKVKVWSDFLGTHLHPWSVHLLSEFLHDNFADPFDVFGLVLKDSMSCVGNFADRQCVVDAGEF